MTFDPLLLLLLVVFGLAAFLFGLLYSVWWVIASAGRGLVSLVRRRPRPPRICSRDACRRLEERDARFCSRCGAPMQDISTRDVVIDEAQGEA